MIYDLRSRRESHRPNRRGSVLVLVVIMLPLLLAILALAVDVGSLYGVKAELQAAADAAALAGASAFNISQDMAVARAKGIALKNYANGASVVLQDSDIQFGSWDEATGFTPLDPSDTRATAIRVTSRLDADQDNGVGLLFGGVFGSSQASVSASAVAVYGSRDIVLALDYSSSMNDDSTFEETNWQGRIPEVERSLDALYEALGSPVYGNLQTGKPSPIAGGGEDPAEAVKMVLGLNGVPYPYPRGSWIEFVNHVMNLPDVPDDTDYRDVFCYRTLVDYLQTVRPMASETPDLWKTLGDTLPTQGEQPLTAVKDAVTLFLEYMNQQQTNDRVGLASYTYTNGEGFLEVPLTENYSQVETTSRQRQAGHYDHPTNVAGGLEVALGELTTRGRAGAFRMIVLLSDGKTNLPGYNNEPRDAAVEQAELAAENHIPILTISLGARADRTLMQEIADISGGIHFAIEGDDVAAKRDALFEVFGVIAAHRPLRLVQ